MGVGVAMVAASTSAANSSSEPAARGAIGFGNTLRRGRIGIVNGREFALRQFGEDARVVFPDVAEAGDANA